MYNITEIGLFQQSGFQASVRRWLTCVSVLLFIGLVGFVFFAVKGYVVRTTSVALVDSEIPSAESEVLQEHKIITVKSGDSLKSILSQQELNQAEVTQILSLDAVKNIASSLKKGQKITLDYSLSIIEDEYNDLTTEIRNLNRMVILLSKVNSIEVARLGNGFVAKNTVIPLKKFVAKSSVTISKSFISGLKELGLGVANINELVSAYSYQVDFQRQIQPGDKVTVITEKFMTESGQFSHYGKILYACLSLADKEYQLYGYPLDGATNHGFFSPEGRSVKRSLLRTPLNVVRISSHYGNRSHPTLGFTKMHRGIDFAAPDGTPIYAAGDGVVTEIGMKSGYGRFIQIKHSANLSTAYAHASNFAKNLKLGSKVRQGEVIAYVGHSGRTTGSHLHYEVKIAGKHVNPMSIKTTPSVELSGKKLQHFKQYQDRIRVLSTKLDNRSDLSLSYNTIQSSN